MAADKSQYRMNPAERATTDAKVIEMLTQPAPTVPVKEIALICSISERTVYRIQHRWVKKQELKIERRIMFEKFRQVQQLDKVADQAWEAWMESRKQQKIVSKQKYKNRVEGPPVLDAETGKPLPPMLVDGQEIDSATMRDSPGEPKFLEVYLKAKADIRFILGANAPIEIKTDSSNILQALAKKYSDEERKLPAPNSEQMPTEPGMVH